METGRVCSLFVWLLAGAAVLWAQPPDSDPASGTLLSLTAEMRPNLAFWDARIQHMVASGNLVPRTSRSDTLVAGRLHDRLDQHVDGVRVIGGDIARQIHNGVTESVFGTLHTDVDIETTPTVPEPEARAILALLERAGLPAERPVELVILPLDAGGYALTWRTHVWNEEGWMHTFLDAHSGEVVLQYNDLQTQAAVGTGTGVLGDRKKLSVRATAGRFVADDQLRPPLLITYDMRGNLLKTVSYIGGRYRPNEQDLAGDTDNDWSDAANVDAHAYLGWTYDYLFSRFGRRGLDDSDAPIYAITHPVRRSDLTSLPASALIYVLNAFWCGGCGPDRRGAMVFGEGLPPGFVSLPERQYVDYLAGALDVVAHELTHGLTNYSSGLIYRNESGALNESFSDIIGIGAEHYYENNGAGPAPADYLIGEDVFRPGGIRSIANPRAFGHPDHYSRRLIGRADNGFVHANSSIPNHAFYLAIEGGVNRTSGRAVTGVGAANRDQIEKIFYRAFTYMLPSNATFRVARAATVQAARDLYGVGSPPERAIREAWTAVGVN